MRRPLRLLVEISTLLCAVASLTVARSAAAQQCPVSQVGQACGGGVAGTCVESTCTDYMDAGDPFQEACAFCEPVACPIAMVGQPCEAGTCTAATCEGHDDGGFETSTSCAVCLDPPANACSSSQAGQPCSNGGNSGSCIASNGKALGPAGEPPGFEIVYPTWICQVVEQATGTLDGDAAAGTSHGLTVQDASTASDAGTASAAAAGDDGAASSSKSSSGCAVSPTPTSSWPGVWLLAGVVALVARRRSRSGARDEQARSRRASPGLNG